MEADKEARPDLAAEQGDERDLGWCGYCICFIFIGGLAFLGVWFSTIFPKVPICSIEQFDVVAPNETTNSTNTTRIIIYDLKLNNKNRDRGIYYDALNLTFYCKNQPNLSFVPIGNALFDPFYQGHLRSARRIGHVQPSGVVWEKSIATMIFRVELRTRVRYKNIYKYRIERRHRLVVGANLQVNEQGNLVKGKQNKGIKLRSGAANIKASSLWFWAIWGVLIIIPLQ